MKTIVLTFPRHAQSTGHMKATYTELEGITSLPILQMLFRKIPCLTMLRKVKARLKAYTKLLQLFFRSRKQKISPSHFFGAKANKGS